MGGEGPTKNVTFVRKLIGGRSEPCGYLGKGHAGRAANAKSLRWRLEQSEWDGEVGQKGGQREKWGDWRTVRTLLCGLL